MSGAVPDAAADKAAAVASDEALAAAVQAAAAQLQIAMKDAWDRGLLVRVSLWYRPMTGRTDPLPMVGVTVARPL